MRCLDKKHKKYVFPHKQTQVTDEGAQPSTIGSRTTATGGSVGQPISRDQLLAEELHPAPVHVPDQEAAAAVASVVTEPVMAGVADAAGVKSSTPVAGGSGVLSTGEAVAGVGLRLARLVK